MPMILAIVCLGIAVPPAPLVVTAAHRSPDLYDTFNDAQCSGCPCWKTTGRGCALPNITCLRCGCSYTGVPQWGTFTVSTPAGCVDMDLLPVPQPGWVYWVQEKR
jgi:hypothetical protein